MIRKFRPFVENGYPTSDGRPMAETDWHRDLMLDLIETLKAWFAADPMVYVSGNLLVFYERGNKRRHVSPDVLVVRGVANGPRPNYLVWEEGKGPDVVIELTSSTTRREDVTTKRALYENTLGVQEYFLFDPREDYLDPSFQGFRRVRGVLTPMRFTAGRLPSKVLGLHLERHGDALRLWNPATGVHLPTPAELAESERTRADGEKARADAEKSRADQLQRDLDALRRRLTGEP